MGFSMRQGPVSQTQPMAEINMIPLVDVMLVLLVIFIITAPLMQQAVPVDLPQVSASALEDKPRVLRVALDAGGAVQVDEQALGWEEVPTVLRAAAAEGGDPELQLYADRRTAYEQVARLIAAAQDAGLARIAFVTEPSANP